MTNPQTTKLDKAVRDVLMCPYLTDKESAQVVLRHPWLLSLFVDDIKEKMEMTKTTMTKIIAFKFEQVFYFLLCCILFPFVIPVLIYDAVVGYKITSRSELSNPSIRKNNVIMLRGVKHEKR